MRGVEGARHRRAGRRLASGSGVWRLALVCTLALAAGACGTARWGAPTEGHDGGGRPVTGPSHTVRRGDTLFSIGWQAGVDYRKIAEWNQLKSPDRIFVGQVLRLAPPTGEAARVGEKPAAAPQPAELARSRAAEPSSVASPTGQVSTASAPGNGNLRWEWPTSGRVIQQFAVGDPNRKGVKIGGRPGQPIVAAEGGRVVYSGSGLVGYGPLIIIKHNNNYLSAYGHNRKLLVQQGDQVTKGTEIAEMGLAGGEPLLHFEIRRDGDPVNPLALLPRR